MPRPTKLVALAAAATLLPFALVLTAPAAGADTPDAPTAVVATPGDGQATVTWTPSDNEASSGVTDYTATATDVTSPGSDGDGNTCDFTVPGGGSGSSATCDVLGLTNGDSYSFAVVANYGSGSSSGPSADSAAITVGSIPNPPTSVVATAGSGKITVSFSPPSGIGHNDIANYVASCSGGNQPTKAGLTSPIVVGGAHNGSVYTCTVKAKNSFTTSTVSAPSASVTPVTVPRAPRLVSATPVSGGLSVQFSPPNLNGGSPVLSYGVTCTPAGGGTPVSASGSASPVVVSGLSTGTTYTCTAIATSAVGDSAPSKATKAKAPLA